MKISKRFKAAAAAAFACAAFLLTGCAGVFPGDIELEAGESAIYIEDGLISYCVMESFDEEYYDSDELESAIDEEVADFNASDLSSGEDGAVVSTFKIKNKEAYLVMEFASAQDFLNYVLEYERASSEDFYIGAAGEIPEELELSDELAAALEDAADDDRIIVTTDVMLIQIADESVIEASENCSETDGVITTADDELSYIIY